MPVRLSMVDVEVESGSVTLTWFSPEGAGVQGEVVRRTAETDWQRLDRITSNASGLLVYKDRDVVPGSRYAYQLRGATESALEVWVDVPRPLAFSLSGPCPNPVVGDLIVSFSLVGANPALLEVFDVKGRRVFARDVRGSRQLNISASARLSAGIYNIRLTQGEVHAFAKAIVTR